MGRFGTFALCAGLSLVVMVATSCGSDETDLSDLGIQLPDDAPVAGSATAGLDEEGQIGGSSDVTDDGSGTVAGSAGNADAETAGVASASEAGDPTTSSSEGTTVQRPGDDAEPMVTVVTSTGLYEPTPSVCVINSGIVDIVAAGDGDLVISGDAAQLEIAFVEPGAEAITTVEVPFGVSPGRLQFITSNGWIIEAQGCDA